MEAENNPANGFKLFGNFKEDFSASIVVFLVALPLCLGIALASGAPLYSGLISGIIGGIVVGRLSGSAFGVSGPAAGLAVIVYAAIIQLGSFEAFLAALVLAGILQLIMGYIGAGVIAYYFPSSVVHGMLAGIGLIIFMKQIPHLFGDDRDPEGDLDFAQADGENTITELVDMFNFMSPGILIISIVSITVLLLWETKFLKQFKFIKLLPAPLVVVVFGVLINLFYTSSGLFVVTQEHLVSIPIATSFDDFLTNFAFPDFSILAKKEVYIVAFVMAIVGSLETLLCTEATDKLDELKRTTPVNQELKAQGVGNIICGLIGGLPITQVVVRSSANQQSGAKSKSSAIFHGFFILISVIAIPFILNLIPLATLASILLLVGYKLAKPALFKKMYQQGREQFLPFMVTVIAILFTDLLTGITVGLAVAVLILVLNNHHVSFTVEHKTIEGQLTIHLVLPDITTFLDKAALQKTLISIEEGSVLEIDATKAYFIHHDVIEIIDDFKINATTRNITVKTMGLEEKKEQNFSKKLNLTTK